MISDIDKDGSGNIDFTEFLEMMTAKMSERDSREEILKAFRLFDDDETGKITLKNLKRVAKEIGENMTDDEIQAAIHAKKDVAGSPGFTLFCSPSFTFFYYHFKRSKRLNLIKITFIKTNVWQKISTRTILYYQF